VRRLATDAADLIIDQRAETRATPEGFTEPTGSAIKLRVGTAPVGGAANERIIALLARVFGVNRSRVLIESGHSQRDRRLRIISPKRLPTVVSASLRAPPG
jgi:uncharacterized protein YggU (UPF0235/DUF167 family)